MARASRTESSSETAATGTSHHAAAVGRRDERVDLDVDDERPRLRRGLRVGEARPQLVDRRDPLDAGAEARRVRGEVDGQHVAVEPTRGRVAEPVAGAEPLRSHRLGQRPDRPEAVVLDEHDDELDPLLDRGHELLAHHQVGAVADHHEHVAVGGSEAHAEAAGDLVAHRRVAVLDVVALRVARPPQLVEVARHRARRADDDVARTARGVDRADHLGLGRQRAVAQRVRALDGRVPVAGQARRLRSVAVVDRPALERGGQPLERRTGVGDEGDAGVLRGVERGDVDVDEPDAVGREQRPRRRREVAPARPDPDDDVGVAGDRVRGRRACGADRAERGRVVVRQRALAGLRLPDRDAGRLDEAPERVGRLAVDDAAAGDDQRPAGRSQQVRRPGRARQDPAPAGARARRARRTARRASRTPRPGRPGAARSSPRRSRPGRSGRASRRAAPRAAAPGDGPGRRTATPAGTRR